MIDQRAYVMPYSNSVARNKLLVAYLRIYLAIGLTLP